MIFETRTFWDDDTGNRVTRHENIDNGEIKFTGTTKVQLELKSIPGFPDQPISINFKIEADSVKEAFENFEEYKKPAKEQLEDDLKEQYKGESNLSLPNNKVNKSKGNKDIVDIKDLKND